MAKKKKAKTKEQSLEDFLETQELVTNYVILIEELADLIATLNKGYSRDQQILLATCYLKYTR